MNIDYNHYKMFYYVAKYKNITQAAKELNNNQPNVSRIIKILEEEMNCKLIVRKSKGIELTPEGENLYFYVSNAFKQLETAEEEITSLSGLKKGTITVGASETAAYMVLLPAINAFKKDYPDIKIKLYNHNSNSAIDLVKQGLVDFSIASIFEDMEAPLVSTTVLTYTDLLMGGPSFKNIEKPLSLREISELPIISLTKNSVTFRFYDDLFKRNRLTLNPIYEVETSGQIAPMLIYDLGVAFVPPLYVQNLINMDRIFSIPMKEPFPERRICIIENKNRYANAAAEKLKEFCMMPREYYKF